MIVQPVVMPGTKPKRSKLKICGIVIAILSLGATLGIFCLGCPKTHQEKNHVLYSSFDSSPSHGSLIGNLQKSKYSVLVGNKADGLRNFVEHYANKLNKNGKKVIIEELEADGQGLIDMAREYSQAVVDLTGLRNSEGIWILISQSGNPIPKERIEEIKVGSSNSSIVIVTTKKQPKLKGFKVFSFAKLDQKIVNKVISKSFGVKANVADILNDYHETDQELFQGLDVEKFDAQTMLKQNFVSFDGLSKEGAQVLKQLCKAGSIKSKKKIVEPVELAKYGVIYTGWIFWENEQRILNYELHSGTNCKNEVISKQDLKAYREKKEKEEEAKRKLQQKKAAESEAPKTPSPKKNGKAKGGKAKKSAK